MSVFSNVYEEKMKSIRDSETISTFSTDLFIRTMFYTTVISTFKWSGDIPKFIGPDEDFIEESLFNWGQIGYFQHNGEDYIAPCFPSGKLLKNGLYDTYTFIFRDGTQIIKKYDEIELCFDNVFRLPSIIPVNEMVEKCVNSLRTVDMLLRRAGLPSIKAIGDEQKVSIIVDKITKARQLNDPYVLVSGDWVGDEVINVPMYDQQADDIIAQWDIYTRYRNQFFTAYGISVVDIAKTERLTQAEGQSNTEQTRYSILFDKYEHRKSFSDRVKKKFNKNLILDINRNFETVSSLTLSNEEKRKMQQDIIAPYKDMGNDGKKIEDKGDGIDVNKETN